MNIKEVVFPVDFSDRSVDVCPYVAAIAQRLNAKLTLLHIVETVPPCTSALDRCYTSDEAETQKRREQATEALAAFQKQFIPQVLSEICVLAGEPAAGIVGYAGEDKGRMIVMPTRGYGPFRRMLLGSVTAKVLNDARCPVLTGPHLESAIHAQEWFSLRRVLCTVSLDWETDRVLMRSSELATQLNAELIAFHTVTPVEEGLLPLVEPGSPPFSTESARQALHDALRRTGIVARTCVTVGEVSRQVARAARAHEVDLVVIGKGGAPELPGGLGSHGYTIVRRSPCPVLCV